MFKRIFTRILTKIFTIIFRRIFTIIFTKIFTRIFTRIVTKIFTIIFTKIFTRIFKKIFAANLLCKLNSNYTYCIYCIYCTIYLQMKIKNCFVFKHWVQIMQKAAYGIIISTVFCTESVKFQFAFYTLFLKAIFLILSSPLNLFS